MEIYATSPYISTISILSLYLLKKYVAFRSLRISLMSLTRLRFFIFQLRYKLHKNALNIIHFYWYPNTSRLLKLDIAKQLLLQICTVGTTRDKSCAKSCAKPKYTPPQHSSLSSLSIEKKTTLCSLFSACNTIERHFSNCNLKL